MPLSTVRLLFAEMTGREDLAQVQIGINDIFYINAGKRFLESKLDTGKVNARYYVNLTVGVPLITIPACRSIHSAILYTSTDRYNLTKADINVLRQEYNTKASSTGVPEYYAPTIARPYPTSLNSQDLNQSWAADEISTTNPYYNALLIYPAPDSSSAYTLEITGLFYTAPLVDDEDTDYWTETHPELLAMAGAYILELTYRNTEGARDWLNGIMSILPEIEKDFVDEELSFSPDTMEVKQWNVR